MHSFGLLSTLALVGSTLAAPLPDPNLVVVTEWKTVYATVGVDVGAGLGIGGAPAPSSKPAAQPTSVKPQPTSTPKPTTMPPSVKPSTVIVQPSSAKPTSTKPTSAAAAATSAPASSSGPAYMAVVSKWRANLKLGALAFDAKLQANALKTANDGNGKMVHELNPGTFGQVLAPGDANEFEKVFVGGWLCEVPSTPGLNGVCPTYSQGWAYNGQTGHNEILCNPKYTKIGCAVAKGIWACDLGY